LEALVAETSVPRQRLLEAAVEVFAAKGYEGASTREICRLADVNVAAIHYYFGDKASLYRELFRLPEQLRRFPAQMDDPDVPVRDALAAFYRHVTAFMLAPEQIQLQRVRLLYLREELQPSGAVENQSDVTRHMHDQLTGFLCRATGADTPDPALHQLAFSIGGLAFILFAQRTAIDLIAPELLRGDAALDATIERLTDHGLALIEAEAARRHATVDVPKRQRRVHRS
jgi:TetR/AcrR family transcriptional regulator, regulator of cefoperazone and chloramphenicol sensitivity